MSVPYFEFEGRGLELGLQQGAAFKERILEGMIPFYRRIFRRDDSEVERRGLEFVELVRSFRAHLAEEMEGIAQASGASLGWIGALNARSELMSEWRAGECTAVYKDGVLGQTWDWAKDLRSLMVVVRLDGRILMLAEPGVLGKIGINSAGLGVTLNFLHAAPGTARGLPIHIVLRQCLESASRREALASLEGHMRGQGGNVIVGDAEGCTCVELAGDAAFVTEGVPGAPMCHTNHYVQEDARNGDTGDSKLRLAAAVELAGTRASVAQVLADPRLRKDFKPTSLFEHGTVATVVMELRHARMRVDGTQYSL